MVSGLDYQMERLRQCRKEIWKLYWDTPAEFELRLPTYLGLMRNSPLYGAVVRTAKHISQRVTGLDAKLDCA